MLPGLTEYRAHLIVLYNLCICFPMSLLRKVSTLRYVTYFSVIGTVYVIIVLAVELPAYLTYHSSQAFHRAHPDLSTVTELVKPGWGMMFGMSYTLSTFSTHTNIPVAVAELANPTSRRLKKVNFIVTIMQIGILSVVAVLGYFTIQGLPTNIVVTRPPIPGSSNLTMLLASGLFAFIQLIAFSLLVLPCRDSLRDLLDLTDSSSYHVLATSGIVLLPTLVTLLNLGLDLVLKIVASQTVWICYFFPSLLHVKLSSKSWTSPINLWRLGLMLTVTILILLNLAVTVYTDLGSDS